MDKIVRDFVWGRDENHKKTNLLKWEDMCQPTLNGGCGIRNMEEQNKAFLSKLAYNLVAEPDKLWVRVLREKYGWGRTTCYSFKTKTSSHIWRSIARVWQEANMHIVWRPGSGDHVSFWTENWIDDIGPLKHLTFADIAEEEAKRPIKDFVRANGQWNYSLFEEFLPFDVIAKIQSLQPPSPEDGKESCYWNLTPNGNFSVSSAYIAAQEFNWNPVDNRMNWVWKWPGGQRVRTFLWLALKGKLLTNAERLRRHMTSNAICTACEEQIEDIAHVLRYCPLAVECWNFIDPDGTKSHRLHTSFVDWMFQNLNPMNNDQVWRTKFGLLCWKFWENRNKRIFQDQSLTAEDIALKINVLTEHTIRATSALSFLNIGR